MRKTDGTPISIPYLVDLEHDHRKPSDAVLNQLATALQVDADVLFFWKGGARLICSWGRSTLKPSGTRCERRGATRMAMEALHENS